MALGGLQQLADVDGAQGRDPVQPGRGQILADAGGGDHAAVADQGDAAHPEAVLDLADLRGQGGGIAGVSSEDLDGEWAAVGGAEQAEDHLPFALLGVAVVTEGGQRTVLAFQVGGGDVVEDQGGAPEVAAGQAFLDPPLALPEPVQHVQHLVAGDRPEVEQDPETAVGGIGRQSPGGGELGGGVDEASDEGGQGQIPLAAGGAMEDAGQAELGGQAEQGGDVAVRQRALEGDGLVEGGEDDAVLEDGADGVDHRWGDFGKVGEGLSPDAFALTPGFSQQYGRGAGAVGDDMDADGHGRRALHGNKTSDTRYGVLPVDGLPAQAR